MTAILVVASSGLLVDCQARSPKANDSHINASLTVINI